MWGDRKIYVPQKGKVPLIQWTNPDKRLTLEEVQGYSKGDAYGIVIPEGYCVIDMDNMEDVKRFDTMLDRYELRDKIATLNTTKGKHYYLRTTTPLKGDNKIKTPFGWEYDLKVAEKGLVTWYINGKERMWDNTTHLDDTLTYEYLWIFFMRINTQKPNSFFNVMTGMRSGDGRQDKIFRIAIILTLNGYDKETVKNACQLINYCIFGSPISSGEFTQQLENGIKFGVKQKNNPDRYRGITPAEMIKQLKAKDDEIENLKTTIQMLEGGK